MKSIFILLASCWFCTSVFAQNLHFPGALLAFNQTGKIAKKFNYNLFLSTTIDAVPLTESKVKYPARDLQIYIQPSIIYVLNAQWNFAVSYTFQRSNPGSANYVNEHRLWQQVLFSHKLGFGKMTHRLRFEERFIQNRVKNTYPLATRLRYQIGFNMPLQGKTLDPKEWYLNTYNESYISLTGVKNATYSENWSYLGAGYNLGKMGKLEMGYLMQWSVRNTAQNARFLHLLQLMWITNFNCSHTAKPKAM